MPQCVNKIHTVSSYIYLNALEIVQVKLRWWKSVKIKSPLQFSQSKSVLRSVWIHLCLHGSLTFISGIILKDAVKHRTQWSALLLTNFSTVTHNGKLLHYKAGLYIENSYIPLVIMGLVNIASKKMWVHQFFMLLNTKAVQKLLSNTERHCSDKGYSNRVKTTHMK